MARHIFKIAAARAVGDGLAAEVAVAAKASVLARAAGAAISKITFVAGGTFVTETRQTMLAIR